VGERKGDRGERELVFFFFLLFFLCSQLFKSKLQKKGRRRTRKEALSYRECVVRDEVDRGLRDLEAKGLVGVLEVELSFFVVEKVPPRSVSFFFSVSLFPPPRVSKTKMAIKNSLTLRFFQ
jgi:hypothetical protein